MVYLPILLLALTSGIIYFVVAVWQAMTYWKFRGVKHLPPWPIVGNLAGLMKLDKHWLYFYDQIYKAFPKERMVGMYEFMTPTLVLRDPEVIEKVLVRDFSTYPDHGAFLIESDSLISESVFALAGKRWRAIRNKLLTTFTTGKMREIFAEIVASCQEMVDRNPKNLCKDDFTEFAVKSFFYSMFGTKILPAGEKEIVANCKRMFEANGNRMLQQYALTYFPKLAEFLGMSLIPNDLDHYFRSLMNTLLDKREEANLARSDYASVLLEMRKMDKMNVYNRENNKIDDSFEINNTLVMNQGFMFFFAGLDTTTLAMLYLAFELSLAKDCQEKARQEIRSVLKKHGGYSWDAVREMKYLDQCIQESLRIHPTLAFLVRICDKDTELEGVKLNKGTKILIPNYSIQMDPTIFTNPEKFNPDRFHESSPPRRFTHLPFSDGPRVCMGKKFATMEIATLFAHILDNFELSLGSETKTPLQYEPTVFFTNPAINNPINIELRRIS